MHLICVHPLHLWKSALKKSPNTDGHRYPQIKTSAHADFSIIRIIAIYPVDHAQSSTHHHETEKDRRLRSAFTRGICQTSERRPEENTWTLTDVYCTGLAIMDYFHRIAPHRHKYLLDVYIVIDRFPIVLLTSSSAQKEPGNS